MCGRWRRAIGWPETAAEAADADVHVPVPRIGRDPGEGSAQSGRRPFEDLHEPAIEPDHAAGDTRGLVLEMGGADDREDVLKNEPGRCPTDIDDPLQHPASDPPEPGLVRPVTKCLRCDPARRGQVKSL